MKSLQQFIAESTANVIKKAAENIESYNNKDQRCAPNEAQACIIDLVNKFKKEGAEEIAKVPSDEEMKEGTWLAVHEESGMILFQWNFNKYTTYYIQEKDRKESVICGAIYMNSIELNEFLIGKIGGDPIVFYNITKKML